MDYVEGPGDDHSNIDDRDLPFEFASNGDDAKQSPGCASSTATSSSAQRSSHPIYQYVTRSATEWTCKTCDRCFKGPRLFNITRHFKRSHPEVFAEAETMRLQMNPDEVASYLAPLISAASNGRSTSPSTSAATPSLLKNSTAFDSPELSVKQTTPKKSRFEMATPENVARRQLASLVTSGALSSTLLDNPDFRKVLSLVPGFSPPSAQELEQVVETEVKTTFARISQLLDSSRAYLSSLALSVDVQLQEGGLPGFVALFAHYYSLPSKCFEKVLLDIVDLPESSPKHLVDSTVAKILRHFSPQLSLSLPHISRITTLEMPRQEPQYRRPYVNLFVDQHGNQRELEESDYCTVSCCPERLAVVANRFEEPPTGRLRREELPLKKAFSWTAESSKHIVCAASTLQRAMAEVFQSDAEVSEAVDAMMDVLQRLTSDVEVMRTLMERTNGNELRIPRSSRWSSVLGAIDRFLTVAPQVEAVCKLNGWAFLEEKEFDVLTQVNTLTNPILRFSERLQATESPTISLLLPGLVKLVEHLKNLNAEVSSEHGQKLISQIEKGFAHVLKSGEPDYDPIYLVSTLLDRRVAHMIVDHDTRKQRKVIMSTISKMFPEIRDQCETDGNEIVLEDSSPFGFGTVSSSISVPSASSLEGSEIVPYFHRFVRLPTSSSSVEFWVEHEYEFPVLSKVATAILAIPASTVSLGSLIATMDTQVSDQWNSLQRTKIPKQLRSSIFLTLNKHLAKGLEDDASSVSGTRSDASCSPTPTSELLQRVPMKNKVHRIKHELLEAKEEPDFVSRKSPRLDLELPAKYKNKRVEERRLSTASSSSKSSGCR